MSGTCDTCQREGEVFVHSSSVGAMSIGSCRECLSKSAEPLFCFAYLYDFVSNDGEGLADHGKGLSTFMEGRYWTWEEWVAWRQHPDRKAEMDAKRDADFAAMNAEEDAYRAANADELWDAVEAKP